MSLHVLAPAVNVPATLHLIPSAAANAFGISVFQLSDQNNVCYAAVSEDQNLLFALTGF
ncbi:hypothetical protein ACIRRA_43445 [Nocardia sp. NPDC101769]|uniref:hypothetical protein n=1 Tax=Nocardia sp. NPDC101769 TaxID=3364333 RepID=UPI003827DED6